MRGFVLVLGLMACNSSGTVAPAASSTSTATTAKAAPSTIPSTPLFTYVEGGDELTFTPPTWVRLERSGADGGKHACLSELGDKGNMWSGADVENAFRNADVQAALRGGTISYSPEIDDAGVITEATLRTDKGTIEWKLRPCRYCVAAAPGVVALRKVLTGVMMNRRLLCP